MFWKRNKNISPRRRLFFDELNKRKRDLPKAMLRQQPKRPGISFSRLVYRWQKVVLGVIAAGVLGLFIYASFFSNYLRVQHIVYAGGDQSYNALLEPVLQPFLGKHFFLIPVPNLERDILQKFPNDLQSIDVSRRLPGTLSVKYRPFPNALNLVVKKENIQRKFILNARGIVTAEDSEDPALPYLTAPLNDFPKIRSGIFDSELIAKMVTAYTVFTEKFGMKVPEVIYLKREREIHLRTEKGFSVWMDITQEIEPQLFKLKRALHKLDIYHQPLQYIDLRISGQTGDKVIFR